MKQNSPYRQSSVVNGVVDTCRKCYISQRVLINGRILWLHETDKASQPEVMYNIFTLYSYHLPIGIMLTIKQIVNNKNISHKKL